MATFYVMGTPLVDETTLGAAELALLTRADFIIAESPRVFWPRTRTIKRTEIEDRVTFLDHGEGRALPDIRKRLERLAKTSALVILMSDGGMPILFDPGAECLAVARELKFEIRSVPGPTSWGTACALSGYPPPYFLLGFLPQKTEERRAALNPGLTQSGNLVLLETPYRLLKLIEDLKTTFGDDQEVFFAWQIGMADENFSWGTLHSLEKKMLKQEKRKGEFILILKQRRRTSR